MFGSAQPDTPFPPRRESPAPAEAAPSTPHPPHSLAAQELDAALQLLVERARYITGATGAALALTQGEEMVCRASAGSSAPVVGARLQVRSGLSGESIARKQLLRCDNAETDPRVNLATCRELGIASIVVLPLLTRAGEVRGIFELFSDHAYAFEERDLIALERMSDLTLTALDLAERRPRAPAADPVPAPSPAVVPSDQADTASHPALVVPISPQPSSPPIAPQPIQPQPAPPLGDAHVHSALLAETAEPGPLPEPEAMRRVQKCGSCGFPVSAGRSLCVDCENKRHQEPEPTASTAPEFVPAFLAAPPVKESWLANHVNLLAVLVLVLSIAVAVVVFR